MVAAPTRPAALPILAVLLLAAGAAVAVEPPRPSQCDPSDDIPNPNVSVLTLLQGYQALAMYGTAAGINETCLSNALNNLASCQADLTKASGCCTQACWDALRSPDIAGDCLNSLVVGTCNLAAANITGAKGLLQPLFATYNSCVNKTTLPYTCSTFWNRPGGGIGCGGVGYGGVGYGGVGYGGVGYGGVGYGGVGMGTYGGVGMGPYGGVGYGGVGYGGVGYGGVGYGGVGCGYGGVGYGGVGYGGNGANGNHGEGNNGNHNGADNGNGGMGGGMGNGNGGMGNGMGNGNAGHSRSVLSHVHRRLRSATTMRRKASALASELARLRRNN